ncbi:MAG: mechanosensitive ion channel family protein [Nitrospinae bacterium]|nr:mechanosensitive ion channel family protein [Nitrospinota bacterium]
MAVHLSEVKAFLAPGAFFLAGLILIFIALLVRGKLADKVARFLERRAKDAGVVWEPEEINRIKGPISFLILMASGLGAVKVLLLGERKLAIGSVAAVGAQVLITLLIAWMMLKLIKIFISDLKRRAQDHRSQIDSNLLPVISTSLKTLLFIGVSVVLAQTLGYSVGAIVASLGIGGVAVALAAKDTLANFFGSVAVMVDRPFRIGDTIKGHGIEGTVEEIGFRSTKIRTDEKSVMVVPNDKLASMVIENLDRRNDKGLGVRRVHFSLGLDYKTPSDKMERAVNSIREIVARHPKVGNSARFVHFFEIGETSLTIQVNYLVKTTAQDEYLAVRHEINLQMLKKIEELGVTLAPRLTTPVIHQSPTIGNI